MNNSDKVYQALLKQSLDTIAKQIQQLSQKKKGLIDLASKTETEIEGLKLQYNEIVTTLKSYQERIALSERKEKKLDKLDEKSDKIMKQQEEHEKQIEKLKEVKENLQTSSAKRKINKKIEKQQEIIKNLQKKQVRIDLRQKAIILPKFTKKNKREKLIAQQQAKVNLTAAKAQDNKELQKMLDPENKMTDGLKDIVYDIKGAFYKKSLEHSEAVLETMKNQTTNIAVRGANAITITKNIAQFLREKREKSQAKKMAQEQSTQPKVVLQVPAVRK